MNLDRLFSVFRISGSGLSAQRRFLEATASNVANIETTETEEGGPYIPQRVQFLENRLGQMFGRVFRTELARSNRLHYSRSQITPVSRRGGDGATGSAVDALQGLETNRPVKRVYEPDNPSADATGYVAKPNINLVKEMTNMMIASRAYEANVNVLNAAKSMMKKALEI